MKRPSWPLKPTALAPNLLMRPTSSWLISPSTISTTLSVASSVTRTPCCRRISMPIVRSRSSIRQPPPCTMIGFMPTSRSSATSRAKPSFSAGSAIAPPPNRMISVDAWKARMNGSASARTRAFCCGETGMDRRRIALRAHGRPSRSWRHPPEHRPLRVPERGPHPLAPGGGPHDGPRGTAHGGRRHDVIAGMIPGTPVRIAKAAGARPFRAPPRVRAGARRRTSD